MYLGEDAQGKIDSVCEGALNQNKKVKRFLLTFPLRFPFVSREKLIEIS